MNKEVEIRTLDPSSDNAKAVKNFRIKAVNSTSPLLTTSENEATHDIAFYERLLKKSSISDGCLLLFAMSLGKILGMVGSTFDTKSLSGDGHVAEVKGLFVSAMYRHQNIGSNLMTTLLQKLSEIGITNVILEVLIESDLSGFPDLRVPQFYEKLGFVRTGLSKNRVLYENTYYDLVYMQKA